MPGGTPLCYLQPAISLPLSPSVGQGCWVTSCQQGGSRGGWWLQERRFLPPAPGRGHFHTQLPVAAWCRSPECHLRHRGTRCVGFPSRRMRCRKQLPGQTCLGRGRRALPAPALLAACLCGLTCGQRSREALGTGFACPRVSKWEPGRLGAEVCSGFTDYKEEERAGGKGLGGQ